MAFLRYRCGHGKYINPPRILHTTDSSQLCPNCARNSKLSVAVVRVRRTLFVHKRSAQEQRIIHLLAKEVLRK